MFKDAEYNCMIILGKYASKHAHFLDHSSTLMDVAFGPITCHLKPKFFSPNLFLGQIFVSWATF